MVANDPIVSGALAQAWLISLSSIIN